MELIIAFTIVAWGAFSVWVSSLLKRERISGGLAVIMCLTGPVAFMFVVAIGFIAAQLLPEDDR